MSMPKYERFGKTYRAWSTMSCGALDGHNPHVWDSPHMVYGPYLCEGVNPGYEFADGTVLTNDGKPQYVRTGGAWYRIKNKIGLDDAAFGELVDDGTLEKM